jgi:hypothetical protein
LMGGKGRGGYGVSVKIYIQVQVCLCLPEIKYLGPEYKIYGPLVRGGQANPQTLGLIPLLLIRKLLKLLKGDSPQIRKFSLLIRKFSLLIRKFSLLIRKLQISKFLKSTAKHCQKSQLSFKLIFLFCNNFNWTVYALFVRSKSMYLWGCGRFSSAKKVWVANRKSTKHNSAND